MKFSFKSLLILAAFAPFALTSCSEKTKESAETTAESAATDAANTTDKAGNAIENAADKTGNAIENATDNAAADVKTDMAPEAGDTAVVRNRAANKMVEEMPAKQ